MWTPSFQTIARLGYLARGTVFMLVAGLALFSGMSGGKPDTKPALNTLLAQPLGWIWVGLIAFGLLGFVVWRLAQAIFDADHQKNGAKGKVTRLALFASALVYLSLSFYAGSHAFGLALGGQSSERDIAAWIMSQPFGKYLAIAAGVGLMVGGGVAIVKGMLRKYERHMQASARKRIWVTVISVYGLSARGLLFVIAGSFFVYAGCVTDPDQAGSMGDALQWLRGLPFGASLYLAAAVGLAAFGGYNFIQAKYRVVRMPTLRNARLATERWA